MTEKIRVPIFEHWYAKLPYAFGEPLLSGKIKTSADDFIVREQLSFGLADEGDHVYLHIRKRDLNTDEVARKIARVANVRLVDIGYAGKKDRHAVTEQWFSVHLPGKHEVEWSELTSERIELLEIRQHQRKLRVGSLIGNSFTIVVRGVVGDTATLSERMEQIRRDGVPNYFGDQRFGFQANNISQAYEMFVTGRSPRSKNLRSLLVSAARSYLFNEILAKRVASQTWNQSIDGEVMMLDGSSSFFNPDPEDDSLAERLAALDIHPGGALWGRGAESVTGACLALEQEVIQAHPVLSGGLEAQGLSKARRALRFQVKDLDWSWIENDTVKVSFSLPAGSYATVVLRELFGFLPE